MAEEQKIETEEVVEQAAEEVQYSETELKAMDQGWLPEDKWEGDPKDHRSAKDFLERGEMIGKLRFQERELTTQRLAIERLSKQTANIYENGYKQAVAELKAQRKDALADGDLVKADEIGDQIEETKEKLEATRAASKASAPQIDPNYPQWIAANPWYNDPVMQKFADSLAVEFMRVNKGTVDPDQVREYVSKTVKDEFAHRFNKPGAAKVQGAPNPDGTGRGNKETNAQTNELSKVEKGMSDMEIGIMKTILRSDKTLTKEKYLKMYAEAPNSRRG